LPGNTREDKKKINLKQLLAHTSGLPAYRPYYQLWSPNWSRKHQQSIVEQILAEPLITSPGTTCHYSDLGFILLGAIIEEHSGIQLEQAFEQWITAPVGLSAELRFLPLDNLLISNKNTIAATEKCSWRGRVLQGEVHDEHCWLMGGVAGHAGLFGTLHGVASLCEILMDIWLNRSRKGFVDQHLLQQALDFDQGFGGRALGFDRPTQGASSSGRYFSGRSVGHLGFSGVSFWLDPEKDMSVVLLTNRIHPSRVNEKIRQFRPWFHDQIVTAWRGGQSG
jgi:CubicO group peptidase (beta-lactamase class C family)